MRTKRKKKPVALKPWLVQRLRRISRYWPAANEAKKRALVFRGHYQCNVCKKSFHYRNIEIDHIKPIVNVSTGFTNWDDYITRMFCDVDGYQILCEPCHAEKTKKENEQRKGAII